MDNFMQLIDNERNICNEQQLWNDKKSLKTVYTIGFNCIFGCQNKGVKDTPEKIEACKQCYIIKAPNIIDKQTVRKVFKCDNVNIFSSKKLALEAIEKANNNIKVVGIMPQFNIIIK